MVITEVASSLGELIHRYEISNRAEAKSPKTIIWYTEMLTSFLNYACDVFNGDDLSVLTADSLRNYIIFLREKPRCNRNPTNPQQDSHLSPRTVQCHVRALKAFSTWLYENGHTTENRLKIVKLPKAPATMIEPLSPPEITKIIEAINKHLPSGVRNHAILVTMLDTGLRASEVAGISLSRLNLQEGFIKVMGKGAKERIVPIGKYTRMILYSYIEKSRPRPAGQDIDELFLSPDGKTITVNTIKLLFTKLAKTSGIERLHAHLCRHTFAINYLLNGGDIFSLREILGHTTLEMVNHYLHFNSAQITAQHHKYSPMDKFRELPAATVRYR